MPAADITEHRSLVQIGAARREAACMLDMEWRDCSRRMVQGREQRADLRGRDGAARAVTITAIWLAILLAAVLAMAVWHGDGARLLVTAVGVAGVAPMVSGLWGGRRWAVKFLRILLGLACVLAAVSGIVALCWVSRRHGVAYYVSRSAVMALWLAYFLRPEVRGFFGEPGIAAALHQPTEHVTTM